MPNPSNETYPQNKCLKSLSGDTEPSLDSAAFQEMAGELWDYMNSQPCGLQAREVSLPMPPYPAQDNPMFKYLVRRALEIDHDQGVAPAIVWVAAHAWFEGGLANQLPRVETGRRRSKVGPRRPAVHLPRVGDPFRFSWCGFFKFEGPGSVPDIAAVTCRKCLDLEALHQARLASESNGQPLPHLSQNPDRDREIARLAAEGLETLEAIGAKFGMSRERIRQIVNREGVFISDVRARRAEARIAEDEALRQAVCRVCRRPFRRVGNTSTCSADCARLRVIGRHYLEPEKAAQGMVNQATTILRRPEKYKAASVRWAERVLAGEVTTPNRRWSSPTSEVTELLRKVGREDLIVPPRQIQGPMEYRCAAMNLSGQPCSRNVRAEGELCHIHRGETARPGGITTNILSAVAAGADTTIEVAEQTGLKRRQVFTAVDRMKHAGLLKMVTKRGRLNVLHITAAGKEALNGSR